MRVGCSGHPQPVSPAQQHSAQTIALTPQSRAGWGLRSHLAVVLLIGRDSERVSDLSPHSYPSLFPAQPPHLAFGASLLSGGLRLPSSFAPPSPSPP